ncbi:hypothetical protein E8E78_22490 [Pseudomonas sp. BN505]|uniref:hypothetical protein n=1 Tax=unclassified Pseudomonas TaxID=196821 RepID=UPI002455C806|nr:MULTISPECIES: hypothetical protein [unclassified Pseudomonas]MDH4846814.1 hypothetical protein [Pseudomonas sp. BN605]MDH4859336.1 hypothetical protein [Pseudomonas sp. BN505]
MAYNSAHTGPQIDAAVEMLDQVQDAREATASDLGEVKDLAAEVKSDARQVSEKAETVAAQTAEVIASTAAVQKAREDVVSAASAAESAKDSAELSADSARQSQDAAHASDLAASRSQLAAGLSEQVSADAASEAASAAQKTADDRAAAEASAVSAARSAQNAEAVVTGGTASTSPEPGKIPLADAQGKIDSGWVGADIARSVTVEAVADAADSAANAAAEAQARAAAFLLPSPEAPIARDDGSPLQVGDRYFNMVEQAEYLLKQSGWAVNDSLVALDVLEHRIGTEPAPGRIPEAGDDGLLPVKWMPKELVRAMALAAQDGADGIGYVFGAENSLPTSVKFKIAERVSVVDFMSPSQKSDFFAQKGLVDQTSALNAFWRYIRSTFVDVSSEDYVKRCGEIPGGLYRVDGSVNFTGLKARNTILLANGAVFHGRGVSKNVVDMTGTRWLQVYGLTVFGDEQSMPRSGILLGPQTNETSGNNAFFGCNFTGHFSKAAIWNIGSETTSWVRSRGANYNTDPSAKVFIGDGKMRNGATSDYSALRGVGTGVSFTNNQFYSCDLRHVGGGAPMWLEATRGWGFDRGCYFLSFNDAIFELYQSSDSLHQNLSIEGLMESTFKDKPAAGNTGCKHQIKFVGDGSASVLQGLTFKVGIPHTALSSIKQDDSSGPISILNFDMVIGHQLTPGVPVFDAPRATITGRVQAETAAELNLDSLVAFNGFSISAGPGAIRPKAGVFLMLNSASGQLIMGGSGPRVFDGAYRADGAGANADFKGRAKGSGNVELGNEVLIGALTVKAQPGSVNGLATQASQTIPYYTVVSVSAQLDVGLRSKGAGSRVQLGNDLSANSWAEVLCTSTFPTIMAAGPSDNHDLALAGKGSGNVRFGTHANASSPTITGYITIKDAGGVIRKLAVIA